MKPDYLYQIRNSAKTYGVVPPKVMNTFQTQIIEFWHYKGPYNGKCFHIPLKELILMKKWRWEKNDDNLDT